MSNSFSKPKSVFVAFLDILGFKDMVENNSTSDLMEIYERAILETDSILKDFWKGDKWPEYIRNIKIKTLMISDSIVIYTNEN